MNPGAITQCCTSLALGLAMFAGFGGLDAAQAARQKREPVDQTVESLPRGDSDRAAIMNAMRARGFDRRRIFIVRSVRRGGDWAFAFVDPLCADDGNIAYPSESALLKKGLAGWVVMDRLCEGADCAGPAQIGRLRKAYPAAPAGIFVLGSGRLTVVKP